MDKITPDHWVQLCEYIFNRGAMYEDCRNHKLEYSLILIELCKKYSVDTIVKIVNGVRNRIDNKADIVDFEISILKIICGETTITYVKLINILNKVPNGEICLDIIEDKCILFPIFPDALPDMLMLLKLDDGIPEYIIDYFTKYPNIYGVTTKLLLENRDENILYIWFELTRGKCFKQFCNLSKDTITSILEISKSWRSVNTLLLILANYYGIPVIFNDCLNLLLTFRLNIILTMSYKFLNTNLLDKNIKLLEINNMQIKNSIVTLIPSIKYIIELYLR